MMTLESAIKHCEEIVKEQEKLCKVNDDFNFSQPHWRECANEHRQLAEWLKDYKWLKEQEPCKKEQKATIDKIKAEINKQEEWLAKAGYNAYNLSIAFESIKRALRK